MFNKVILMGRLTKDPEMVQASTGTSITKITIAVDRKYKSGGEEKQTDFLNITVFGKTAEFVKKYFIKGQMILVAGSIQTRNWEKDGQKYYAMDIIGEEISFVGSKSENSSKPQTKENVSSLMEEDTNLPWN